MLKVIRRLNSKLIHYSVVIACILLLTLLSVTVAAAAWNLTAVDDDVSTWISALALDNDGNPVIAYYVRIEPYSYLTLVHCDDPNCLNEDPVTLEQLAR